MSNQAKSNDEVPEWLRGVWRRDYIRRAGSDKVLKDPDSTVEVRYIQTPWAFVDIRRPKPGAKGSKEVAMAFAGATSVSSDDDSGGASPPLVSWHSCLDLDATACPDAADRWAAADADSPKETEDKGFFRDISTPEEPGVYIEKDPDGTLEERWVRIDDGGGRFLAARRGTVLFVVAGRYFGFAAHAEDDVPATFVAGKAPNYDNAAWIIEQSAANVALEGTELALPGKMEDWLVLAGSTLKMDSFQSALKFSH